MAPYRGRHHGPSAAPRLSTPCWPAPAHLPAGDLGFPVWWQMSTDGHARGRHPSSGFRNTCSRTCPCCLGSGLASTVWDLGRPRGSPTPQGQGTLGTWKLKPQPREPEGCRSFSLPNRLEAEGEAAVLGSSGPPSRGSATHVRTLSLGSPCVPGPSLPGYCQWPAQPLLRGDTGLVLGQGPSQALCANPTSLQTPLSFGP